LFSQFARVTPKADRFISRNCPLEGAELPREPVTAKVAIDPERHFAAVICRIAKVHSITSSAGTKINRAHHQKKLIDPGQ
jgi:hypothetical protein